MYLPRRNRKSHITNVLAFLLQCLANPPAMWAGCPQWLKRAEFAAQCDVLSGVVNQRSRRKRGHREKRFRAEDDAENAETGYQCGFFWDMP